MTGAGPDASDHPRSRGVYGDILTGGDGVQGSSPLARGLHKHPAGSRMSLGIIPARAGFTGTPAASPGNDWDHPRSRGVYLFAGSHTHSPVGSSPLARGLLPHRRRRHLRRRIIPARAGFTTSSPRPGPPAPDHPRSRGVYELPLLRLSFSRGSSPLARGLRAATAAPAAPPATGPADHPRSRGVYVPCVTWGEWLRGSSPLARGLRARVVAVAVAARIIPARAGFTASG